jgi:hypothetical protein
LCSCCSLPRAREKDAPPRPKAEGDEFGLRD